MTTPQNVPTPSALASVLETLDASQHLDQINNLSTEELNRIRLALTGGLEAEPVGEEMSNPAEDFMRPAPGTDVTKLSVEELSQFIGAARAMRTQKLMAGLKHTPVEEQPRKAPAKLMTRATTSREPQWCKMAADGFTPLREPAMQLVQEYDQVVSVPTGRTWTFRDPFRPTSKRGEDIVEKWTVRYPCRRLDLVARDITRAWQLYSTKNLDAIDFILLANTPLAVEVDGITCERYSDLWSQLRHIRGSPLPSSTRWRVVHSSSDEITSR